MTDYTNLIKSLQLGASISRERSLNLDYAKVADEAADAIETLQSRVAMLNTVVTALKGDLTQRAIEAKLKGTP